VGPLTCAPTRPPGKLRSISGPQQILPLKKVALKAHACRNPETRDDASLDLLSGAKLRGAASASKAPRSQLHVGTDRAFDEAEHENSHSCPACL
jgi:hypothetical protein